ncbi:MAG: hypothetical protein O2800_00100 [Planctomycetota bacterium]|nr:hypothetical protein [Planctomycetota bacterium]
MTARFAHTIATLVCSFCAGALTLGCADESASQRSAATKAIEAAGRAYTQALDAESSIDRASALRAVAARINGLTGANDGQLAAGALIAGGASLEAGRTELSRASALALQARRHRTIAARVNSIARSMEGTAQAFRESTANGTGLEALRAEVESTRRAVSAEVSTLEDEVAELKGRSESASVSAATAMSDAAAVLADASSGTPLERVQASQVANDRRLEGIEDSATAATALSAATDVDVDLALSKLRMTEATSVSAAIDQIERAITAMNESTEASAERADAAVTALRARAQTFVESSQLIETGDLQLALENAANDFQLASSQAQRAARTNSHSQAARHILASAQIELARIELMREMVANDRASCASIPDSDIDEAAARKQAAAAHSAALEALATAIETVAMLNDEALTQSVTTLSNGLKGIAVAIPLSDTVPTAVDADDAEPEMETDGPRLVGGLDSPEAIFELVSGVSIDAAAWSEAIGTRKESLAPAVGTVRQMILWVAPMSAAASEAWGAASGALLNESLSADSPPVLSHDGGDTATIEYTKADGTAKTLDLFSQDGKWFVALESMLGDDPQGLQGIQMLTQFGPMLQPVFEGAATEIADRIRAGEFASTDEAKQAMSNAIGEKIQEVMQQMRGGAGPAGDDQNTDQ